MKSNLFKISLILLTLLVFTHCETTEDPEPEVVDNSLIIANSNGNKYVIVSPSTGIARAEVEPAVNSLQKVALGYQSQKAVITSKEPSGGAMKVIYTCDRESGANLFQVTSEQDWDVMFIDASQTSSKIVFSAQNANQLSDDNIHKINEDGSGYQRLSSPNEVVDCYGVSCKIWSAYDPSWSPDGNKIAFDLHLREVVELHPHNSIAIMDTDGSNKQVLFDVNVEETHYHDICWTRDGQFLIFLHGLANETKVKVLHISSKTIFDITNNLMVEGLHPTDLWTSPTENKIYFNKYEPGGGDLYQISYKIEGDQFIIDGSYSMLAEVVTGSPAYGEPYSQKWNGN